jgi:hypothetical protein
MMYQTAIVKTVLPK